MPLTVLPLAQRNRRRRRAGPQRLGDQLELLGLCEAQTVLGRLGQPEEIAGAAVLLASRAGSHITGHTLVIDGGTMVV